MASLLYTSFIRDIATGSVDCDTDSFKGMLVTSSYTANKDHDKRDDITNEVSGTGYTAGGAAVTLTTALDTTNDRVTITPSEPSWSTATITARGMVIYKARGGASSADELVAFVDFGSDVTSTAGTFATDITTPITIQN